MEAFEKIINYSQSQSKHSQAYHREKNRMKQFYSYLRNNLSEDESKTLERLMKCQNKIIDAENMRFFVNGFKLGMSFAIETLN